MYPPARIHCACGNQFETRSTRGSFSVEICSKCHPFYTGKYKLIDTAGRVERFRKKYGTKADLAPAAGGAKAAEGGVEAKPEERAEAKPEAKPEGKPEGEKKAKPAKAKA